ncbi:hypothetical protein SXCC_00570 [Gluconacetobacter sp. SXCC-1]|nr:hypothetical protein SXCC_00570 [Gluconacetobacter sp. SXCC-1]
MMASEGFRINRPDIRAHLTGSPHHDSISAFRWSENTQKKDTTMQSM